MPIASFGVVMMRICEGRRQYLMVQRKDTLGYIDFLRGRYLVSNKWYILNMLKQMTAREKQRLHTLPFTELWRDLWGINSATVPTADKYRSEERASAEKFGIISRGVIVPNKYSLASLIDDSDRIFPVWGEPEWGFPKGRRLYREVEFDCAIREFEEETGYSRKVMRNVSNLAPFDEIFTGSNYKSYKHRYYLMTMKYVDSLQQIAFDTAEIMSVKWMYFDECLSAIRPYNAEKIRVISRIEDAVSRFDIYE
jgi:8-oxo-dGTP pyrophosphatase MutT (NUDIX family)